MPDRFANTPTPLLASDTVMVNSTLALIAQAVKIDQGICAFLYLQYKLTAGSASQKIDVYGVYSTTELTLYDEVSIVNCPLIGTFNLINDTGTYHNYSIRLDGTAVSGQYMKIALLPSSAGAGTIAAGSLKMVVRSPK